MLQQLTKWDLSHRQYTIATCRSYSGVLLLRNRNYFFKIFAFCKKNCLQCNNKTTSSLEGSTTSAWSMLWSTLKTLFVVGKFGHCWEKLHLFLSNIALLFNNDNCTLGQIFYKKEIFGTIQCLPQRLKQLLGRYFFLP